jgi:hypothetical protein
MGTFVCPNPTSTARTDGSLDALPLIWVLGTKAAGGQAAEDTLTARIPPPAGKASGIRTRHGTALNHRVQSPHSVEGVQRGTTGWTVGTGSSFSQTCGACATEPLRCCPHVEPSGNVRGWCTSHPWPHTLVCVEVGQRGLSRPKPWRISRACRSGEEVGSEAWWRGPASGRARVWRGGQTKPSAKTCAQQGLAPDCLQRPLVPRFRFRQQVKPGVRCLLGS